MKDKKIMIAVPCMDMVSARFAQSLATLKKVGTCTVSFLMGSLIYDSRNRLAGMAVQMEADYILWLDSDMVFQPDTLERMMRVLDEHPEVDVLSGLYFRRGHPFTPVIFSKLEIDENGNLDFADYNDVPDELFEVAGCDFKRQRGKKKASQSILRTGRRNAFRSPFFRLCVGSQC